MKARALILEVVEKSVEDRLREADAGSRRQDVLQLMIDAVDPETGKKLTLPEIKDQALLQLFAGHDTTGHTMTWLLFELARHPDIQAEVQQEADAFFAICGIGIVAGPHEGARSGRRGRPVDDVRQLPGAQRV